LLALAIPASAENKCHVLAVDFKPAELTTSAPMRAPSQIVAWVEDAQGQYVDTVFITQETGTFGLGNRPGRFDFNSGPRWPYGRRVTVFPVWAHRRAAAGATIWPEVGFQDASDSNLSHAFTESSRDLHFCRPLDPDVEPDQSMWDAGTCASTVYTDKGVFHPTRTSLYPPRADLMRLQPDSPSVDMYETMNPFDAVSTATPPSGMPAMISWPIPEVVPNGDYVLWVEVSREFDPNNSYNTSMPAYAEPTGISYQTYGEPYRGQPSVVYKVPFSITSQLTKAITLDYVGYGAPDGADGNVRPPDSTISTTDGSGAGRLAVQIDGSTPYRVRVVTRPELDGLRPGAPTSADVNTLATDRATIEFTAPGDDGLVGKVKGYEIRYTSGMPLDEQTFASAIELKPDIAIADAGQLQEFSITGLLPDTEYSVGIRAVDDCRNVGALAVVTFRTPERQSGEVDACFVATAAYGSLLANDVEMLRRFRDFMLQSTVLGELAVEAYYTFGPAVAGVVGESEVLRATARAVLSPIVTTVKALSF
jgi:hypothetical protein